MSRIIRPGRLETITGCMFSGKTEELIRRIRRLRHGGLKIQVFNPFIDNRYSSGYLSTHDVKNQVESYPLSDLEDLSQKIDNTQDGYAFDEIQFMEGAILDVIEELRRNGKLVLASGLNMDYAGRPFKFKDSDRNMGDLLVVSDSVFTLDAVCKYRLGNGLYCPNPATRTQRLVASKELVLVGGKDFYEARCPEHHTVENG